MMTLKRYVLNKGEVECLTHTSQGDLLVINAARCSFDKAHEVFDKEKDARLINYLAREKHLLPFRHPQATFRITLPIFVLRQLGKHQVGFSWSEVSRRYITAEPEFWEPHTVRSRPENIKQGSEVVEWGEGVEEKMKYDFAESHQRMLELYSDLLDKGVAPEQARAVLPQSMYTTVVVTGSLLGWWTMVKQRTDPHTQEETRHYAYAVDDLMSMLFPVSWASLKEHNA